MVCVDLRGVCVFYLNVCVGFVVCGMCVVSVVYL